MNHDIYPTTLEPDANGGLDHLENRVQSRLNGRIRQFRVLFDGRGIVLRGFTRTYYAKQLAQHAVMTETQVPIRANEIEVG